MDEKGHCDLLNDARYWRDMYEGVRDNNGKLVSEIRHLRAQLETSKKTKRGLITFLSAMSAASFIVIFILSVDRIPR